MSFYIINIEVLLRCCRCHIIFCVIFVDLLSNPKTPEVLTSGPRLPRATKMFCGVEKLKISGSNMMKAAACRKDHHTPHIPVFDQSC